jgi:hypothetical protein
MSQWTHVNCSIRYDGLPHRPNHYPNIYDIDKGLPRGTEGSLNYHIIQNPDPNSYTRQVVVWWGDLRDYNDREEVLEYFESMTHDRRVRSGILEIYVEGVGEFVYKYYHESGGWRLTAKVDE